MDYITLTKNYGSSDDGIYWFVPGGQQCKLPELYSGEDRIQPSIFIELPSKSGPKFFFVVENPGNINGACYVVYYDKADRLSMIDRNRVTSLIHNSQDVVGIRFVKDFIHEKT